MSPIQSFTARAGRAGRAAVRLTASLLALVVGAPAAAAPVDPLAHVDPFIGTAGHGHTFPGATRPFGMVQISPDTRLTGWDGCSGYHDSDRRIFGFSHTHLSGTGCSDYGDILVLPATGPIRWKSGYEPADSATGYGSFFDKAREQASPGYYAVTLSDYGVTAELTATLRAGLHRYTFAKGGPAHLLLDLNHRDPVIESELRVVNDHEVEGLRRSGGWGSNQRVYFVLRTDRPFAPLLAVNDTARAGLAEVSGKNVKAALRFTARPGEVVQVQVGLSAVDLDGARQNLDAEIPGWDFAAVHELARSEWRAALSKVEIGGGTPEQQTTFYTALYHTMIQPNTFSDADHRYRGRDDRIHQAQGWTQYTVFSLWDTFRAAHPLYTLVEPERTVDFIQTFLAQHREGGRLPVWELFANETNCMIGYHAVPVIVDAWARGIRGFDENEALLAMQATANAPVFGLPDYRRFGYLPSDKESESVSKTLEYAYDDWCIARMTDEILGPAAAARWWARAASWRNILDPATGFMRPKGNGRWLSPFRPTEVDFNFTEANSWQYSFFVPHDVTGLAAALAPAGAADGGRGRLAARLDSLFEAPSRTTGREQPDITGLIGQYAHGNEPSHHIAYLYDSVGQPWKTQRRVRQIMDTLYSDRRDGLSGNEDCGQMSAWYVLSALGFYSDCPGRPDYAIGSPLFPEATIHLANGKSFTIRSKGGGADRPYIQGARLTAGGRTSAYDQCRLPHAAILAGGTLEFTMGDRPNESWGVAAEPGSAAAPAPFLPVPYVAAGDSPFHDSTSVVLASPVPGAAIWWSTAPDGPRHDYTAPIPLTETATLRFGSARGALNNDAIAQEATFHRIPGHRKVVSLTATHHQYTAGGNDAFIDGIRGGPDFRLGTWLGFYGTDMEAVIDLGEELTLHRLAVGFLQDQNSWIFMPRSITFELSLDGQRWSLAGASLNDVDEHADGAILKEFGIDLAAPERARFVRARAKAPIDCPAWHKGAGNKSFIFADEFITE